jgi:hypothetical protein
MDYKTASQNTFAHGTMPDGFFGDRAEVDFHFDKTSGKTFCIVSCGCFLAPIPPAVDEAEALWLLNNHPSAYNIRFS